MEGYRLQTGGSNQHPPAHARGAARLLLAVILVSLVVGGIAGGVIGGGATYLVMAWKQAGQPTASAYVPAAQTLPTAETVVVREGSAPIAEVAQRVGPAVVTVVNKMNAPLFPGGFQSQVAESSGSGVIVDPRGYIVTNYHVVEDADELTAILSDGTRKTAHLVGHDYPFNDVAVIKIEGDGFPYAVLGDSSILQVGEQVVAIGSALGDFRNTVTTGIVSGLGRSLQVTRDVIMEGMIQTDAAINHGNSGGPLVNMRGEVIGLNTAIIRGAGFTGDVAEGLGFAIPSNTVRYVVDQLIAKGKVSRPYLGVRSVTVNPSLADYYRLPVDHGVYVTEVIAGTPAAQAGIREDDIIVKIGEDTLDPDHPLINVLSHYQTGQKVTVEVNRGGQTLQLEVTLGERP